MFTTTVLDDRRIVTNCDSVTDCDCDCSPPSHRLTESPVMMGHHLPARWLFSFRGVLKSIEVGDFWDFGTEKKMTKSRLSTWFTVSLQFQAQLPSAASKL
jgi:hypothetical protein